MLKIIKEDYIYTDPITNTRRRKNSKLLLGNKEDNLKDSLHIENKNSQTGKISNEKFFEIQERVLNIIHSLEVIDSFAIINAATIEAQTDIILKAIDIVEKEIVGHLEIQNNSNEK